MSYDIEKLNNIVVFDCFQNVYFPCRSYWKLNSAIAFYLQSILKTFTPVTWAMLFFPCFDESTFMFLIATVLPLGAVALNTVLKHKIRQ